VNYRGKISLPSPGAPAAGAVEKLLGRPAAAGHSPLSRRKRAAGRQLGRKKRAWRCVILGRGRIGGGAGVVWE